MNVAASPSSLEAVRACGGPRERGRAWGEALGARIHAHVDAWLGMLARAGVGDPRPYVAAMLRDTDFKPAIRHWTPGLLEEVEAAAAAAAVEPDLVYGLQLLDEEWAYRIRRASAASRDKCSSLAIAPKSGTTWIGQNMDLGAYTDGHQALLEIGADGDAPAALVFTVAGMVGLMGVNASGVGVCVNSLPQLPSGREGLPVAFVLRRLLQARSLAEASELVLAIPHATNQHYVIAEAGAARAFEASFSGVAEYHPPDPARILHTNHPLADGPRSGEDGENSLARLQSLVMRLSTGNPGLAEVQAALSSSDDPRNPVSRTQDADGYLIGFTCGSMISALGETVESWVSPGPPSERGYARFTLTAD